MATIGERIKEARLEKDMTQKQLGKLLNLKQHTISQWENGTNKPPIDLIKQIALALDCDANFLFGFDKY